jgi:hypothetical protein
VVYRIFLCVFLLATNKTNMRIVEFYELSFINVIGGFEIILVLYSRNQNKGLFLFHRVKKNTLAAE